MSDSNDSNFEQGELRTDFLGRSVVLTPGRAARPHDFTPEVPIKKSDPAACYFCPGNELKTPPEIDRIEDKSAKTGWSARAFPNKFPAFSSSWPKAHGLHEVVVETSHHAKTLSQLSDRELCNYLTLVVRRLRSHARDKKIKATVVFKNEWEDAGASLEHTHTQLVAMPEVPPTIKLEEKLCKTNCPFCLLSVDDKYSKIIDGPMMWLSPYAPRFNYETWIVPKQHIRSLSDLDEAALLDLASTLGRALRTQDATLNYPPYNILYHLAPHKNKNFHFHIEITPRLAKWAGYEYAAGVVMNSVRPEKAADEFRQGLK